MRVTSPDHRSGFQPTFIQGLFNIIAMMSPLSRLCLSLPWCHLEVQVGQDGYSSSGIISGEENVHLSYKPSCTSCLSWARLVTCSSLKQSLWLGQCAMLFGCGLGHLSLHWGMLLALLTPQKSLGSGVGDGLFHREKLE